MTRSPGLEATILKTLEEEGEVRPPESRLAQEYFWMAASRLQAQGKVVADQRAGVVRRPAAPTFATDEPVEFRVPVDDELCCSTCGRPNVLHGINCPTLLEPPTAKKPIDPPPPTGLPPLDMRYAYPSPGPETVASEEES